MILLTNWLRNNGDNTDNCILHRPQTASDIVWLFQPPILVSFTPKRPENVVKSLISQCVNMQKSRLQVCSELPEKLSDGKERTTGKDPLYNQPGRRPPQPTPPLQT